MANAREIQSRMKSIQDTMKITNAMYMISSSKLKRAKKSLSDTEPYFYSIQSLLGRVVRHVPDFEHFYFDERPEIASKDRKKGYIVVTADKGLAGAYNHNILKIAQENMDAGGVNKLFVVGMIGRQYFARKGVDIAENFEYTAQRPSMHRARMIASRVLELYKAKELDEIHVIYTKSINGVTVEAETVQLLPLQKSEFTSEKLPVNVHMELVSFYPSVEDVIESMVPNFVTGFIFGALVESYACEQIQRMIAMEAATDSAKSMLRELSIIYNRARQAAITQEITEVVSGAKAQQNKKKK